MTCLVSHTLYSAPLMTGPSAAGRRWRQGRALHRSECKQLPRICPRSPRLHRRCRYAGRSRGADPRGAWSTLRCCARVERPCLRQLPARRRWAWRELPLRFVNVQAQRSSVMPRGGCLVRPLFSHRAPPTRYPATVFWRAFLVGCGTGREYLRLMRLNAGDLCDVKRIGLGWEWGTRRLQPGLSRADEYSR
jgi:hypothetical protein